MEKASIDFSQRQNETDQRHQNTGTSLGGTTSLNLMMVREVGIPQRRGLESH